MLHRSSVPKHFKLGKFKTYILALGSTVTQNPPFNLWPWFPTPALSVFLEAISVLKWSRPNHQYHKSVALFGTSYYDAYFDASIVIMRRPQWEAERAWWIFSELCHTSWLQHDWKELSCSKHSPGCFCNLLLWQLDNCKKGLLSSPNLSPVAKTVNSFQVKCDFRNQFMHFP